LGEQLAALADQRDVRALEGFRSLNAALHRPAWPAVGGFDEEFTTGEGPGLVVVATATGGISARA